MSSYESLSDADKKRTWEHVFVPLMRRVERGECLPTPDELEYMRHSELILRMVFRDAWIIIDAAKADGRI